MHSASEPIEVHALPPGVRVRCGVLAERVPAATPEDDAAWARAHAINPRLHDGPILAVRTMDAGAGVLRVAADSFKRLVTRADGSVRLLGVKAAIVGVDAHASEHVLIARRHPHTRCYGGLWELAPGGGVGPGVIDPASNGEVREPDLLRHLAHEAHEELGLDLLSATVGHTAGALLTDRAACSVDVVFAMRWRERINPRARVCRAAQRDWEYVDTAWLARQGARGWVHAHGAAVSPPTVALLKWMGWL